jgi:hypothetical protein
VTTPEYEFSIESYNSTFTHIVVNVADGDTFAMKMPKGPQSLPFDGLKVAIERQIVRRSVERLTRRAEEMALAFEAADEAPTPANPPAVAEALIQLFSPKRSVENMLGDMQELFETDKARFGIKRARRKYWNRAARELLPLIWHRLKRIGLIAFIIDYCRAKFGV